MSNKRGSHAPGPAGTRDSGRSMQPLKPRATGVVRPVVLASRPEAPAADLAQDRRKPSPPPDLPDHEKSAKSLSARAASDAQFAARPGEDDAKASRLVQVRAAAPRTAAPALAPPKATWSSSVSTMDFSAQPTFDDPHHTAQPSTSSSTSAIAGQSWGDISEEWEKEQAEGRMKADAVVPASPAQSSITTAEKPPRSVKPDDAQLNGHRSKQPSRDAPITPPSKPATLEPSHPAPPVTEAPRPVQNAWFRKDANKPAPAPPTEVRHQPDAAARGLNPDAELHSQQRRADHPARPERQRVDHPSEFHRPDSHRSDRHQSEHHQIENHRPESHRPERHELPRRHPGSDSSSYERPDARPQGTLFNWKESDAPPHQPKISRAPGASFEDARIPHLLGKHRGADEASPAPKPLISHGSDHTPSVLAQASLASPSAPPAASTSAPASASASASVPSSSTLSAPSSAPTSAATSLSTPSSAAPLNANQLRLRRPQEQQDVAAASSAWPTRSRPQAEAGRSDADDNWRRGDPVAPAPPVTQIRPSVPRHSTPLTVTILEEKHVRPEKPSPKPAHTGARRSTKPRPPARVNLPKKLKEASLASLATVVLKEPLVDKQPSVKIDEKPPQLLELSSKVPLKGRPTSSDKRGAFAALAPDDEVEDFEEDIEASRLASQAISKPISLRPVIVPVKPLEAPKPSPSVLQTFQLVSTGPSRPCKPQTVKSIVKLPWKFRKEAAQAVSEAGSPRPQPSEPLSPAPRILDTTAAPPSADPPVLLHRPLFADPASLISNDDLDIKFGIDSPVTVESPTLLPARANVAALDAPKPVLALPVDSSVFPAGVQISDDPVAAPKEDESQTFDQFPGDLAGLEDPLSAGAHDGADQPQENGQDDVAASFQSAASVFPGATTFRQQVPSMGFPQGTPFYPYFQVSYPYPVSYSTESLYMAQAPNWSMAFQSIPGRNNPAVFGYSDFSDQGAYLQPFPTQGLQPTFPAMPENPSIPRGPARQSKASSSATAYSAAPSMYQSAQSYLNPSQHQAYPPSQQHQSHSFSSRGPAQSRQVQSAGAWSSGHHPQQAYTTFDSSSPADLPFRTNRQGSHGRSKKESARDVQDNGSA
eukprot:m.535752 g.535752  ORF g.535752 m.535752 type:complete len:1106 (-) comp57620_c0_seq2:1282-4599(-)